MKHGLVAAILAVVPAMTLASSDDAWADFRAAVERSCRALVAGDKGSEVAVEVNPFGSERYGAALVTAGSDRMICIYDKVSHQAELTAPFTDAVPPN